MAILLLSILTSVIAIIVMSALYAMRRRKLIELIEKIPGPPAIAIFGNALQFPLDRAGFSNLLESYAREYAKDTGLCRIWIGNQPIVMVVLSSTTNITKSNNYDKLVPWLGTGLLISMDPKNVVSFDIQRTSIHPNLTGEKWRRRRKMLTPAFHFSILNNFVEVFNDHALQLREYLMKKAIDGSSFDIYPCIGHSALDIICETAMGVSIGAQKNENTEYVTSVKRILEIIFNYERSPWLWLKPIFYLTGNGFEYDRCLRILRDFTTKVIKQRYDQLSKKAIDLNIDMHVLGQKLKDEGKRLALLDLLLTMQKEHNLSDEDIREEVDTFMFEGHDTTAAGMSWALFVLGHHMDIQNKIYDEMFEIFGTYSERMPTSDDLKRMHYMEVVIKETMRLFPPVSLYARRVEQNFNICGYELPIGSTLLLAPTMIHRDQEIYGKDAEEFKPERFLNEPHRHPYGFVPFSAGPRNCIGQRFAMNEMKVILSTVIRNFRITSLGSEQTIRPLIEMILRPSEKLLVRVEARNVNN